MGRIKGAQARSSGAEWCSVSRLPHTLARSMLLQVHKLPHNYPEGTQREERQARQGESERGKSRTGRRAYCHQRVQGPGPDVCLQAAGTQMMAAFSRLSPINEKHSHLKVSSFANIISWLPLLNTRLVIVLFKSLRYSKCDADTLSVLSSCFDERCEARALSVLAREITENRSIPRGERENWVKLCFSAIREEKSSAQFYRKVWNLWRWFTWIKLKTIPGPHLWLRDLSLTFLPV